MCGIAGVIARPGERVSADELRRIGASIRHRGPDDEGYLMWSPSEAARVGRDPEPFGGRVGLVHKRLSILDLSSLGWQPMSSPDRRYYIVYNGEVYNFIELRQQLETLGHCFTSRSDTEVILAAITQWGVRTAVRLFEGMFAFALLDTRAARLTLVRDPFGIKPLYFADADGRFVFGSEIKALLAADGVSRAVNPGALLSYLAAGNSEHGRETMLAAVRQLPPASILTLAVDGTLQIEKEDIYWELRHDKWTDIAPVEAAKLVRDRFIGNVQRHLRSDVPVGTALSGGIDSSAIVDTVRQVAPTGLELHAFSYIADDPRLSEARWVQVAADASRAIVHEVHIAPDELARSADALILTQDEPFAGTSIYAQNAIFRAAHAAGVKVMLDGQGADELFAGYASFVGPHVAWLIRHAHVWAALRLALSSRDRADVRIRDIGRYLAASSIPRWIKQRIRDIVDPSPLPRWLNRKWFEERGASTRAALRDAGPGLPAQLAAAVQTGLLALLRYEDRNSMAYSVESRVPFLTTSLAELALSLPPSCMIAADGTRKAVLRSAMRGIVPDAILDRRDKIGFQTPERTLLSGSWAVDVLHSPAAECVRGLDHRALRSAATALKQGSIDPSIPVWRWLNVIRWSELLDAKFV